MRDAERPRMRLRELNKRRTREAIVQVAVELFVKHGYRSTTLAEIAAAAGIAPSTLHAYFPLKEDLLFSIYDAVLASAAEELSGRSEPGIEVVVGWVEDVLPEVLTRYGADALVHSEDVIRADPELRRQQRFRDALLEDILAGAFSSGLEPGDVLAAQVIATIALHAIREVWTVWYEQHAGSGGLKDFTSLTANHVKGLLDASREAIAALPGPAAIPLGVLVREAASP